MSLKAWELCERKHALWTERIEGLCPAALVDRRRGSGLPEAGVERIVK